MIQILHKRDRQVRIDAMNNNKNLNAVILAGGSGTRFWPMSRRSRPKQFLNISGDGTLLGKTITRILPQIPAQNIWIVTNAAYKKDILSHAKSFGIPTKNILWEPSGKNTAPAILWAATVIHKINPQAVIAVLPSDHVILHPKEFLKVLKEAVSLADKNYLVTLGIKPTRPETGYGYLKTAKSKKEDVLVVEQFTEKPNLQKAKTFLKNKNYFWSSGMFVWRTSAILHAFQKYLPQAYGPVARQARKVEAVWSKLPNISVDYAILEKAPNVAAVAANNIGWSDVGSWESLAEVLPKDPEGNIHQGEIVQLNCQNTMFLGHKRLIAAVGLKDLIVIDTDDALLICPKHASQRVKDIVSVLNLKDPKLI